MLHAHSCVSKACFWEANKATFCVCFCIHNVISVLPQFAKHLNIIFFLLELSFQPSLSQRCVSWMETARPLGFWGPGVQSFYKTVQSEKKTEILCVLDWISDTRFLFSITHAHTASFHCVQLDVVQSCLTLWEQNLSLFVPFPDN